MVKSSPNCTAALCICVFLLSGKQLSGSMASSAISEYSSSSSPGFLRSTVLPSDRLISSFCWIKTAGNNQSEPLTTYQIHHTLFWLTDDIQLIWEKLPNLLINKSTILPPNRLQNCLYVGKNNIFKAIRPTLNTLVSTCCPLISS